MKYLALRSMPLHQTHQQTAWRGGERCWTTLQLSFFRAAGRDPAIFIFKSVSLTAQNPPGSTQEQITQNSIIVGLLPLNKFPTTSTRSQWGSRHHTLYGGQKKVLQLIPKVKKRGSERCLSFLWKHSTCIQATIY